MPRQNAIALPLVPPPLPHKAPTFTSSTNASIAKTTSNYHPSNLTLESIEQPQNQIITGSNPGRRRKITFPDSGRNKLFSASKMGPKKKFRDRKKSFVRCSWKKSKKPQKVPPKKTRNKKSKKKKFLKMLKKAAVGLFSSSSSSTYSLPSFYLYETFSEAWHVWPSNKNEVAPTEWWGGGKTYFPLQRRKKTNFVEKVTK